MKETGNKGNLEKIPCGQCIGCRLQYSRDWATRCMLEAKEWENNHFITLTYNDMNIPLNTVIDTKTGEVIEKGTLKPDELTKFMKDLRRHYEYHEKHKNIRFYACGEYGEKYERPHYHAIIFNLPINDLERHKKTPEGMLYTSKTIEKIWGKGYVVIAEVNWNTAAYVARYMLKKQKGQNAGEYYEKKAVEPEFVRMSRMPGIAYEYYQANKDKIYKDDTIIICGSKGKAQKVKPASYFDKMYDIEYPEKMEKIKKERKELGKQAKENKLKRTELTEDEYNKIEATNKSEVIKALNRKYENGEI